MITVDQLVEREVLCNVSCLISDLAKILPHVPGRALRETSFDEDEMYDMFRQNDWEEPAREHIRIADRDDLISMLEDHSIGDDREVDDIVSATLEARDERRREMGDEFDEDEDLPFPLLSDEQLRAKLLEHFEEGDGDWEEFCDSYRIEAHTTEAYCHYVVTDWFGEKLKEHGEVVGEIGGLTIWGRTTCGQMISMDHVVQQIHKELCAG